MATADVSKVPGDQKAVLASLNNLFNFCMQAANTPGAVGSISGQRKALLVPCVLTRFGAHMLLQITPLHAV